MKIESPAFTLTDIEGFIDGYIVRERALLVERFENASERLGELGPRIRAERGGESEWSSHEVLAHIAVFSKFYGAMVYKVGSGQLTELDMLGAAQMRDPVDEQMAQRPPEELLEAALGDHRRTLHYLRQASPEALRREAQTTLGRVFRTEEIARYPLLNHLEEHVEQLEKMLA